MSTAFRLADLDPDDPRTVSQQIANSLRAGILRGQLAPGDRLPSQHELVGRYGVARETIKAALRVLDREQLIISRQGSGSFVRSRLSTTPDVAEFLAAAYDRPQVTIDYAGWRGETLSKTLPNTLDALRRSAVKSLRIRLLLTDPRVPAGLPQPIEADHDQSAIQPALIKLTDRAVSTIRRTTEKMIKEGLLERAYVQVCVHRLGPMIKIYTVNGERSLIGFYPVTEHALRIGGSDVRLHHPSGWEATTFEVAHQTSQPSFAAQAAGWFESLWSTIGTPY